MRECGMWNRKRYLIPHSSHSPFALHTRAVLSIARRDFNVPVRHRPMVSLEHQRTLGRFLTGDAGWRDAFHLDVLVNDFVVERHFDKLRVGYFLIALKFRRLK